MTQNPQSPAPLNVPASAPVSAEAQQQIVEQAAGFKRAFEATRQQIAKAIVGHQEIVDGVLVCLFVGGHALLEGVPGLGKTLIIRSLSQALSLKFSRIQFTPDLMPADITGTTIVVESQQSEGGGGGREFRFQPGPIFAQMVLADEINRATPKTQTALLEAMQEKSVTVGGKTHLMDQPFFVLATQNPIEQEGTYPLPEAQLDRFMFMIGVGYPDEAEEMEIVRRTTTRRHATVTPVLDAAQVQQIQEWVRDVPVADHVVRYALRLVRSTRKPERNQSDSRPDFAKRYLAWGAGPRASQYLILASKARALLDGRAHPNLDDIRAMAHPVLRHRLITNFNAEADGVTSDDIIDRLLDAVRPDAADAATAAQLGAVVR